MSLDNNTPASMLVTDDSRIAAVATWHATMALKAYRKKDWATYTRHIRIADKLRTS
jgi:hypothetical protein